jgi:hypothetical protein
MGTSQHRYTTEIYVDTLKRQNSILSEKNQKQPFLVIVWFCSTHTTTAVISHKFKDRMSLIQKLKFAPVIKRKQNTHEDMNCIPILYSEACTPISCGYHT